MNIKGILVSLLVLFVALISEADTKSPKRDRDNSLTKDLVSENLQTIYEFVTQGYTDDEGKNATIDATFIDGFVGTLDFFVNYPDIEEITGVSRDWYKDLIKILKEMHDPREKMDAALLNNDDRTFNAEEVQYEKFKKKFLDLFSHPRRASGRR